MSTATAATPLKPMPTVCAVLLTADRPEMTRVAIECVLFQTYKMSLCVWDSGEVPVDTSDLPERAIEGCWIKTNATTCNGKRTIGELRNAANSFVAAQGIDIMAHFDSDDWSHPNRIAEQVRFLQSSGAGCVGYNEMLFWREQYLVKNGMAVPVEPTRNPVEYSDGIAMGQAWLYRHPSDRYALGTSLCYWASAWNQRPFRHINVGEDKDWINGVDTRGVTSLGRMIGPGEFDYSAEPRMIARIHSHNTTTLYRNGEMEKNAASINPQWKRVVDRDEQLRRIMEGE